MFLGPSQKRSPEGNGTNEPPQKKSSDGNIQTAIADEDENQPPILSQTALKHTV